MDMSLRLTTVHENARSAVECGSLLPLSLRPACWPWKSIPCLWRARPRASSRDQSGSKLPHSKAPAALNSCVFNRGFAYFHGSEESASYLLLPKADSLSLRSVVSRDYRCHSEEVAGRPTNNLLLTVRNRKSRFLPSLRNDR